MKFYLNFPVSNVKIQFHDFSVIEQYFSVFYDFKKVLTQATFFMPSRFFKGMSTMALHRFLFLYNL